MRLTGMLRRCAPAMALALALALALAGCAKNVPQESKSGEDARVKGAKEMKIENNEARARGIVTYPGGDRVDWKVLELPKDKVGTLTLRLKWTPPRPGLDLSFEVFNEYNRVIASAKPNKRKKSRKTSKTLTLENQRGKVFIQIYASERGDAGAYTLTADWKEFNVETFDWLAVEVNDPPKLPAVPVPGKGCTPQTFDAANPNCANVCPQAWDINVPACLNVCPNPPRPEAPACKLCNKDRPDPCLPDCKQFFPPCDVAKIDMKNPNCWGMTRPTVDGLVTDVKDVSPDSQITINLGTSDGIDKTWTGNLLDAGGQKIKPDFKLTSVGKTASVAARVKLPSSSIGSNTQVRLTPPPPGPPPSCRP